MTLSRHLVGLFLALVLSGCAGNSGQQALRRGMRALEKGKYTESISWFQRGLNSITANDERAMIFNGLGICYARLGQEKNALQAFESAGAANPAALEPIYNMGVVFFKTGNEDKAMACFEKAALLNEKDPRAFEFMATIYSQRQQWNDARRVLNEALRHAPRAPRILTSLAVVELKANNINQALELLQTALEQDARYSPAIYNLAVINQHYLQKHDQALPLLVEYARLVPSGPQAEQAQLMIKEIKNKNNAPPPVSPTNIAVNPPAAPVLTAIPPTQTAQAKALASPAPKTVAPQPAAPPPAQLPSFEELMDVAKKLEQQGRREAAFNNYLRIARAAEHSGKTSIRNQALRHATSLADGNPQASYDLGVYFLEKDRKDEAMPYFKTTAEQNLNPYAASMATARLALEKNDYDTVIVSLKKADQTRPGDPEAIWLLAEIYDRQLVLTNSAASAYAQFAERFPNDRRAADALRRLRAFNLIKPAAEAPKRNEKPPSFLQRFFKSPAGRTNETSIRPSNGAQRK